MSENIPLWKEGESIPGKGTECRQDVAFSQGCSDVAVFTSVCGSLTCLSEARLSAFSEHSLLLLFLTSGPLQSELPPPLSLPFLTHWMFYLADYSESCVRSPEGTPHIGCCPHAAWAAGATALPWDLQRAPGHPLALTSLFRLPPIPVWHIRYNNAAVVSLLTDSWSLLWGPFFVL